MTRQINFFLLHSPPCTYAPFHNLHLITIIITENKVNPQPMQETALELQTQGYFLCQACQNQHESASGM